MANSVMSAPFPTVPTVGPSPDFALAESYLSSFESTGDAVRELVRVLLQYGRDGVEGARDEALILRSAAEKLDDL